MRAFSEGMLDMPLRVQPWEESDHKTPGDYYDFRRNPELIRTHLEEFAPFDRYQGVQDFYSLIEELNGPDSVFETNDARLLDHLSTNNQADLANKQFLVLQS